MKDFDYLVNKLKQSDIFKVLTDEETKYLIQISEFIQCKEGEEIIKEGEISSYLYVILKGTVSVMVKQKHEGKEKDIYICTIGEGDVIGEAAIFSNVKRTANVVVDKELSALKLERKVFVHFIKKFPTAGIKILMLIIYSLLKKLKEVNHELAFERKATIDQSDVDNVINDFLNK